MSVQRIASRYAKSLFDSATEQNKLDRVLADMKSFITTSQNSEFAAFLKSPIISISKKMEVVKALFDGKFDPLTLSFMAIVFEKKREAFLPEMGEEFVQLYRDSKNISSMKLITAAPVSETVLGTIKTKLAQGMTTSGQLEITAAVDESLIGGFVVDFGDKQYNASVAHQLKELKRKFSATR